MKAVAATTSTWLGKSSSQKNTGLNVNTSTANPFHLPPPQERDLSSHHHNSAVSPSSSFAATTRLTAPKHTSFSASFRSVFNRAPHRAASNNSLNSAYTAANSTKSAPYASTPSSSDHVPQHPYAAMVAAPLPVVSSHAAAEEEEECPVCLEPLSFSFRLPGEKPHIVPECGHALHEVSLILTRSLFSMRSPSFSLPISFIPPFPVVPAHFVQRRPRLVGYVTLIIITLAVI